MFANFATAIPTGAGITFMLLFAMQSLIAMQPGIDVDASTRHPTNFVRVKPPEDLFVNDAWKKPEIPDVEPTPPLQPNDDYSPGDSAPGFRYNPAPPPGPTGGFGDPFMNDGPLIAIVKVQPTYPVSAVTRGLEGFVIVEFDVFADGTVGNISVLQSSNSIFDRAAKQAASRFRFKVRVIEGVPLATSGVQYRFTFEMDD